jgi:hypothetical protein
MSKPHMEDIPVRNETLLTILNEYVSFIKDENFETNMHLQCQNERDRKDYWVGERHLKEIVDQGTRHEGFPDAVVGYEMGVHREHHQFYSRKADALYKKEKTAHLAWMNESIMRWLGARHTALTAVYPPGGFISWHNNANAAAYNLIFTWSETGEGAFKYVDPITKEVVVMPDKQGWQCKAAYFGPYNEPENLFYHAAETDCWRITCSFTFNIDPASVEYRQEIIEDIKTP